MKKITLLLFLISVTYSSLGQVSSYTFTQATTTYTEITGGVLLGTETTDDQRIVDPATPAGGTTTTGPGLPIGFDFTFNGEVYDRFAVNANGWISLGKSSLTPSVNNVTTSAYLPLASIVAIDEPLVARIAALGRDLQAQVGATLRFETIGVAPNRTLVVQWKNFKKYSTNGVGDQFNFQIRLNETTNIVEVVYGSFVNNENSSTYHVGLRALPFANAINFVNRTSETSWSATTAGITATNAVTMDATIKPDAGLTFIWTPPSCPGSTELVTSNITTSTATITWTEPSSVPANGYEYVVSPIATAPAGAGTTSATNAVDVTNLDANTNYYVYVRSICGADIGTWVLVGSFKTLCVQISDFYQNFDSLPTGVGNLPDCWSKAGTSANVYTTTGGASPGTPPNRLYMNISATTTAYAIMPPLSNLQAATHRLRLKAYATVANKTLNVGYFTDPADVATFVSLQTFNLPSTAASSAQEFTYIPDALPAGVNQLVLTIPSGSATTIYIDDVKWEFNSPCVDPTQLTANQITNSSAQLGWVNGGSETVWEVQYGLTNFQLGTGTIVQNVTTNTNVVNGLISNTNYHFYVRAICIGDVPSSWSGPFDFKTQCDDQTSLEEDFEGYPTGAANPLADCWGKGGNGTVNLTTGSVAPMSPTIRLTMVGNGSLATPTVSYAILPPLSNLQANTHRLKLIAYATVANRYLEVGYLTDPSNVNSYVFIENLSLPSTTAATATEFIVIPNDIPAGVKNLVLKNQGIETGATTAYIDDVIWEPIPACNEVSDLAVLSTTNNSAQVAWIENGSATDWEIQYGTPGFEIGTGTIVSATTNPYELTGLSSDTNYSFYVRAQCSASSFSPWIGPIAFKTLCDPVIAYQQNFEGYATGTTSAMPICWARAGNGATYIITGSVSPMSPPNRLQMTASSTANPATEAYALMPIVSNLQANTHRLKFKAYATTNDRFVEVGYLTDPLDIATYTYIQDVVLPGTTAATAEEFTVIPGALTANASRLVFKNSSIPGAATTIYIDDVKWEAIPTCIESTDLTVTGLTNDSVTLSWVEGATATEWEIEYGTPGFVQGTGIIVPVPSNPFTLVGLTQNTDYQVYLRAVCSVSDSSYWTDPITFTTFCADVTEYTQNFEGIPTGTAAAMPDCWGKLGNGAIYPTTASVAPMSPPNRLYMTANSTATIPTVSCAVLPAVSNLQANTHRLKFKAYATSTYRTIQVGYLTNATDLSSFASIQEIELPGTTAAIAQEYVIYPGALPLGVKNLAIKNPGLEGVTTAYFDDFVWEAIPSCLEPTNLFASQLSQTSVSLSWNASGSNETLWDVEYGASGFELGTGTLLNDVSSNPYSLGSLTENISYQFYVRAVCSTTDNSVWVGPFTFKTLCSPVTEYSMDFVGQTTGAGNLPNCWSRAGSSANVYTTTGSVAPMSPSNRLYMNISASTEAYAILPPFSNIQANTHRLKFKAYATAANKELQVGYFTNTPDLNTFVALENIQLPGTAATTALDFIVVPSGVPAGVSQLVIKLVPGTAYTVYLDDFVWEAIPQIVPSCATNIVAATDLTCGNFATQISWDAAANADAYRISIGTSAGATDVLNNENVGAVLTYAFEGNANTTYYYTIIPYSTFAPAVGCVEQTFTTAPNGCVCTPIYTSGVSLNDMMSNVVITGTTLSNSTGNSTTAPFYNYYSGQPNFTATLGVGSAYDVAVTVGSGGAQGVAIWIDFNNNLTFEESERIGFTSTNIAASSTGIVPITIPCVTQGGLLRMRIRNVFNTAGNTIDPCTSYTYGEVEDYDVTIVAVTPPTGDAVQSITADTAADATIDDLVVVGTGIKWFASEADALANVNQLPAGSLITDGTTYYAVSSSATCNSAALAVTANVTLSVGGFDNASFKYYPNPVTDVLTVFYSNVISEVVIYNLLGQQVLTTQPNATQTQMDVSGLTAGTYLMKVTSEEVSKMIKVVKN